MAASWVFADNSSTTLTAVVSTTPSAGTSEAWVVAATSAFPSVATGVTQFAVCVTPAAGLDPTPEVILVTNTNDGTHLQVQRGYGGTIKTHAIGDTLTLVVDTSWFSTVETFRSSNAQAPTNTYTTSITLALADAGCVVEMNAAGATVVTIPTNASVGFPTGTVIGLRRYGAGTVTVTPISGVTMDSVGSKVTLSSQYSTASLHKRATNEWVLSGDLL